MIKRFFDVLISSILLICLSPIIGVTYLLVRKKLGKPVLFRQVRPGKDGLPFKMIKFRSMKDATDSKGNVLPDEERLTEFGKKLRALSLDELPALWNVLKGDMSLVGPRPLLMSYLERYDQEQNRRHEVRPGITGWAQVNGRNAISWDEKFKLDVWYVDHQSMWLDIKILFLTVKKVVIREGISAEGHSTMPEFKGKSSDK
ncbi:MULTISPECIES: sugar transferase [Citrobacter]|uniref:Sugar transferase n=1 Tax=Citrobacter cronae TaxID=1748967 RepID=A0ABS1A2B4_9ENTR|nr:MULTISPECIES: sugar transferase [Citrobacter]HAT2256313.1 sugar transferase [Citrobacter freundii]AWS96192.1 sugar transferase [Citrobacter sp. CRE-46]MBJ8386798.1 sugar transferase [Citrobacter cronae]MBJ8389944.1 sugar transferase [Citrobacter cronae]MBU5385637.1 sugar transferase [Citrobacter cronae]